MRILIYADFRFLGGAPLALLRLARGLSRHGARIQIMGRMNKQILSSLKRDSRIEAVIPVKKNNFRYALKTLKPGSVNLILGSSLKPLLGCITVAQFLRRPLCWRMMGNPKHLGAAKRPYSRSETAKIIKFIGSVSDGIITVSDYLKKLFAANGVKACTIHNGCDPSMFRPDPTLRKRFRKKLLLRQDETAIGLIANFHPSKNHETLSSALSILRKKKIPFKAFLIGGAYEDKMKSHLNRVKISINRHELRNSVVFLDFQENMTPIYNALDIVVFPFLDEGCSNALLESMACEKAVIVNSSGSFPEIILNGKEGLIVPPHNPQALAGRILWLIKNNVAARKMGARARKRIVSQFSLSRMVLSYKKFFNAVSARHQG